MERFNSNNPIDNAFRDAFAEAEVLPLPQVWDHIQNNISKPTGEKKGFILFQIAAVISLVFVAGIIFFQLNNSSDNTTGANIHIQSIEKSAIPNPENKVLPLVSEETNKDKTEDTDKTEETEQIEGTVVAMNPEPEKIQQLTPKPDKSTDSFLQLSGNVEEKKVPAAKIYILPSSWSFPESKGYSLNMSPYWKKIEENDKRGRYWAQAGFGAGNASLSDGFSLGAMEAADFALDGTSAVSTTSTTDFSGTTFSTGFGIGVQLRRKWLLETGVSFMTLQLQATSNTVESIDGKVFPVYYTPRFRGDLQRVDIYGFTNDLQFVSVPAKIGFKIIDKRVGWLVSSGFSTNILLNQSIQSNQYDSYKTSSKDSPFKPVYFTGLIGTEVFVRIGKAYQLGILTNYNVALMNIAENEAPFELLPNQFQLGLNMRYIFK